MPGAITALSTEAKVNRGSSGWFKREDGTMKWGKTAMYGGGAGLLGWTMLDKNAGAKIGGAAGGVGSGVGNLFGGLGSGLLGGLFRPEYMMGSCSSCISSVLLLVVFFLIKQ